MFETFIEITESIDETVNSNEDFKTDKGAISSNANDSNIVSTNISGNSTNEIRKENQSCDSSSIFHV